MGSDSLLGLSYLVVTNNMFFFSLLKRKAATERPFEVWGAPSVRGGEGNNEEKLFGKAQ